MIEMHLTKVFQVFPALGPSALLVDKYEGVVVLQKLRSSDLVFENQGTFIANESGNINVEGDDGCFSVEVGNVGCGV